jgi:hypothetical protein
MLNENWRNAIERVAASRVRLALLLFGILTTTAAVRAFVKSREKVEYVRRNPDGTITRVDLDVDERTRRVRMRYRTYRREAFVEASIRLLGDDRKFPCFMESKHSWTCSYVGGEQSFTLADGILFQRNTPEHVLVFKSERIRH